MPDRDVYRELQQHLDRMPIPFPSTESGVEIRILNQLFTPEEARIALCLSALPEPVSTIHRRIKRQMSREALIEALERMGKAGLIQELPTRRGKRYGKAPFVVGMYEGQVNRLTPQFERDTIQYLDEALGTALSSLKTQQMRTVPVNRTIVVERGIAQYDDIREVVRNSEGPFAVMNCICRQGHDLLGQPCGQTTVRENCLTFGMAAKMMVERGPGRLVTKEEMLEKLDQADREGLVLQPQNTQNPLFVCCCCGCCCGVLTTAKKLPRPADFFCTNYYAVVDAETCQACGTCVTRCQMEAIAAEEGPAEVDLSKCIGCGLCVSTCPSGALRMEKKAEQTMPPKNTPALYGQIFRERYGPFAIAGAVGKNLLGLKV